MISIFRKIRQQLLTENSFSKYLLYAVGEIILVVIGILLALQINNWNTANTEKQHIQKYYTQLQQEFSKLAEYEMGRLKKSNLLIKNLKQCQQLMAQGDPNNIQQFKDCLPYLYTTWEDRLQYPIFQEFLNEGWMSKIDNPALKNLLTTAREKLLLREQMDNITNKKFEEQVEPFFNKNINRSELPSIQNYVSLMPNGPATNYIKLFDNMELWGLFNAKHNLTAYHAFGQEEIIKLLNEIVEELGGQTVN